MVHPGRLTRNLKRKIIFPTSVFGFKMCIFQGVAVFDDRTWMDHVFACCLSDRSGEDCKFHSCWGLRSRRISTPVPKPKKRRPKNMHLPQMCLVLYSIQVHIPCVLLFVRFLEHFLHFFSTYIHRKPIQ